MIYFDNAATTKPSRAAIGAFLKCADNYGNPSSAHAEGLAAEKLLEDARTSIAKLLGAHPKEVFFTSGGTESNNTAVFGSVKRGKKSHFITSVSEHPSVQSAYMKLSNDGYDVSVIPVDESGLIDIGALKRVIRPETCLLSVIHCNSETGITQNIAEIGAALKSANKNALFHVDAVQSFGKQPLSLNEAKIDILTISAHKINGFKGTGALFVREGANIKPFIHGGEQQNTFRPGTENIGGILAFTAAAESAFEGMAGHFAHVSDVRNAFLGALDISGLTVNGFEALGVNQSPYVISVSFPGARSEVMINALSQKGLYASAGAACSTRGRQRPSLTYLGIGEERAGTAVRFSFSRENTVEEALAAARIVNETSAELRACGQ